jgi:hypothetical protein
VIRIKKIPILGKELVGGWGKEVFTVNQFKFFEKIETYTERVIK